METTHYPGTSVDYQRTTRRYMPGDRTHNNRENIKSYKTFLDSCMLSISTLKMEQYIPSVNFYHITRYYILESTL
jgi:hypothetical protein